MGGTGDRGRVPGSLGAWCPRHNCVHPVPLPTREKRRDRRGARHLARVRGELGVRWGPAQSPGVDPPPSAGSGAPSRGRGPVVESHPSRRTQSTRSVPLVSRIRVETPRVSWGGAGRAPGGSAPDAGGCQGSGRGGAPAQVRALPPKSLCRASGVSKSMFPTASECPSHPLLCPQVWRPASHQAAAVGHAALGWGFQGLEELRR